MRAYFVIATSIPNKYSFQSISLISVYKISILNQTNLLSSRSFHYSLYKSKLYHFLNGFENPHASLLGRMIQNTSKTDETEADLLGYNETKKASKDGFSGKHRGMKQAVPLGPEDKEP